MDKEMPIQTLVGDINDFWFGEISENGLCSQEKSFYWWKKDSQFDLLVKRKFASFLPLIRLGELDEMLDTAKGTLAFILLSDQFSRNIYRGLPESFAFDTIALATCKKGMESEIDSALLPIERVFFYMPLMHSEDISIQELSVQTFLSLANTVKDTHGLSESLKNTADFAQKHFKIIEQFGRYPHRNAILGRESTPEEKEFFKQPNSSF